MSIKKRVNERQIMAAVAETVRWLNRSPLGCRVERIKSNRLFDAIDRKETHSLRHLPNIRGTTKDGKAIWIERIISSQDVPARAKKRKFMQEEAERGAVVGCAYDYGDAYDIVAGLKRKKRTFNFTKERTDGKTEKNGYFKREYRDDPSKDIAPANDEHGDEVDRPNPADGETPTND